MLLDAQPFEVSLARSKEDVVAAQRLRYRVFVAELGGEGAGVDHDLQIEADEFDPFAEHILLRDKRLSAAAHEGVVGVYRLMTRDHAKKAGRFYSESEFDLSVLTQGRRRLLELGRSCLHPEYRGGAALMALWQGVSDYAAERDIDTLFGVASFHGTDQAPLQNALSHLHHSYLAPKEVRVSSRMPGALSPLAPDDIDRKAAMRDTPALIKSYLKLGGCIGEGVFIDHAFNTTDVCMLLDTARMPSNARLPKARRLP